MKVKLLNLESTKSETIEVSDKILKHKINYKLIKSVIDWQLNHLKPRTAKTKQNKFPLTLLIMNKFTIKIGVGSNYKLDKTNICHVLLITLFSSIIFFFLSLFFSIFYN